MNNIPPRPPTNLFDQLRRQNEMQQQNIESLECAKKEQVELIHYLTIIVKKLEEENKGIHERMRNLEKTVEADCHSMKNKLSEMEKELKLRTERMDNGKVHDRLFRLETALICQRTTSKRDRAIRESDDEYEFEAKKRRSTVPTEDQRKSLKKEETKRNHAPVKSRQLSIIHLIELDCDENNAMEGPRKVKVEPKEEAPELPETTPNSVKTTVSTEDQRNSLREEETKRNDASVKLRQPSTVHLIELDCAKDNGVQGLRKVKVEPKEEPKEETPELPETTLNSVKTTVVRDTSIAPQCTPPIPQALPTLHQATSSVPTTACPTATPVRNPTVPHDTTRSTKLPVRFPPREQPVSPTYSEFGPKRPPSIKSISAISNVHLRVSRTAGHVDPLYVDVERRLREHERRSSDRADPRKMQCKVYELVTDNGKVERNLRVRTESWSSLKNALDNCDVATLMRKTKELSIKDTFCGICSQVVKGGVHALLLHVISDSHVKNSHRKVAEETVRFWIKLCRAARN